MSHGAGPYVVKNVIITFFKLVLEFLEPRCSIWLLLEMTAKSTGTAETGYETSFQYLPDTIA